jgi:hypothetical protein
MSGRPPNIPTRGDVAKPSVARLMGLSSQDFDALLPQLRLRGFPEPDCTTGLYCVEAVDQWRLRRHSNLFPNLNGSTGAVNAAQVFAERRRASFGVH